MFIVSANHITATLRILFTHVISWFILGITHSDIAMYFLLIYIYIYIQYIYIYNIYVGRVAMGTGSFLGVKCGRSVLLTTHTLLVPW